MKNISNYIIYGVIPTTVIFLIYYLFSFSLNYMSHLMHPLLATMLLVVWIFSIYRLLTKYIKAPFIIYYTGFNYLIRPYRLLIFSIFYLIYLTIFYFIPYYDFGMLKMEWYIAVWIIGILLIEAFFLTTRLSVVFVQVTPRLYMDMIYFNIHTKEDISKYDVIVLREHQFDLNEIVSFKDIFYDPSNFKNYNEVKVSYIDYDQEEHSDKVTLKAYDKDDQLIWIQMIVYKINENNKAIFTLLIDTLIDMENA